MERPRLRNIVNALVPAGIDSAVFLAIGVTCALVLVFLVSHLLAGSYDRRLRRAERRVRAGSLLREGIGAFHGVAQRLGSSEFTGVLVTVTRMLRRDGDGVNPRLVEVDRRVEGGPFELFLGDGHAIEVDVSDPILDGFAPRPVGTTAVLRSESTSVRAGQRVWITGQLHLPPPRAAGAYRSQEERPRLGPDRGTRLLISTSAPTERWKRFAAAHRAAGWHAFLALAAMHLTFWRKLDRAVIDEGFGVVVHVTDLWEVLSIAAVVVVVTLWVRRLGKLRAEWAGRAGDEPPRGQRAG